ncbi:MAG: bifunctional hydroxymethylpyrimidine kinase/phosphomethylpyrimidine kinase [Verrucomicrobiota bacterium]
MNKTVCLTVAGSDSGGGAGIQADLKAFAALGVHGASAVTCLTAQNPDQVSGVFPVDPGFVALQIRTVCDFFSVSAVKTGMVYSSEIIQAVAEEVDRSGIAALVVDPVMVSTSGARLLSEDALESLMELLIPRAAVVTPNVAEAEIIGACRIRSIEAMEKTASRIADRFGVACVVKGGHSVGDSRDIAVDVMSFEGRNSRFSLPRAQGVDTHGSGCAFASAIAAGLAVGKSKEQAVAGA